MTAPVKRSPRSPQPTSVTVRLPITLGQFVKLAGLASTGGDAKRLVVEGLVQVNCVVETRRGHKLSIGDVVEAQGVAAEVGAATGIPPSPQPRRQRMPGAGPGRPSSGG